MLDTRIALCFEEFFKGYLLEDHDLTPLKGGFSLASLYAVTVDQYSYVLRLLDIKKPLESRQRECFIAKESGERGLAPRVHYHDQQSSVLIMDFIQGKSFTLNDLEDEKTFRSLVKLLKKMHRQPIKLGKARSLHTQILRNLKLATHAQLFDEDLKKLHCSDHEPLCWIHNDLNENNIMHHDDGPLLIDWDLSGLGSPYSDLSALVRSLPRSYHQRVLDCYFDDNVTEQQQNTLKTYFRLQLLLQASWGMREMYRNGTKWTDWKLHDAILPYEEFLIEAKSGRFSFNSALDFFTYAQVCYLEYTKELRTQ